MHLWRNDATKERNLGLSKAGDDGREIYGKILLVQGGFAYKLPWTDNNNLGKEFKS